jgi:hypothetical protein
VPFARAEPSLAVETEIVNLKSLFLNYNLENPAIFRRCIQFITNRATRSLQGMPEQTVAIALGAEEGGEIVVSL